MANVLNRHTLEYLPSVNTPDYPPADWIINPDMSAVADVPRWQWVIDGDTLRPADEDERAVLEAARIPDWRRERIAAIDARTKTIVTSGVEIAPGKVVGTTIEATQNLQNLVLGVNLGTLDLPQDISTVDGGSYTITGSGDLVRVAGLLTAHQRSALDAGRALRAQVLAATSIDAVNAVEDIR
jgi:hypothetical protein